MKTNTRLMYFFKYSLKNSAEAPRLELDKATIYSTVEFQYQSTSLLVLGKVEKYTKNPL